MRKPGPDGGSKRRLDERGQTLQDYALGIGLFSLVVVGVLSGTFTTALAPLDDGVGADKQAQADRIAAQIVANASGNGPSNGVIALRIITIVSKDQAELRDRYDVANTSHINISVHELNGSVPKPIYTTDKEPGEQPAATSTRTIRLTGSPVTGECRPACRLVVRVW